MEEDEVFKRCQLWAARHDAFSLALFSNVFLGILFMAPGFFGISLKWFRVGAICVYFFSFVTSIYYCDPYASMFSLLFIVTNIFRLLQRAYQHRKTQIPKCLQDVYEQLFKTYHISRPDFLLLTEHSQMVGVAAEEFVFKEGGFRANRSSVSLLISGHMTAWCDGLPLHTVEVKQFLDSVEWKSFQCQKVLKNNNNVSTLYQFESPSESSDSTVDEDDKEDDDVEEIQVGLQADEDSFYIQFNGTHLEALKIKRPDLFYILDSMICRDISKKMYSMNDGFSRGLAAQISSKSKNVKNPLVRSLSFDTLHTASHGIIVSENWFNVEERFLSLKCLHDKNDNLISREGLRVAPTSLKPGENSGVAYMIQNSHRELLNGRCKGEVIPSLMLQALHLNPESCRFRDKDLVREIDWAKSMEHCGLCTFCKPLTDGEPTKSTRRHKPSE